MKTFEMNSCCYGCLDERGTCRGHFACSWSEEIQAAHDEGRLLSNHLDHDAWTATIELRPGEVAPGVRPLSMTQVYAMHTHARIGRELSTEFVDAIRSAPWGRQDGTHGRVFVTDRRIDWDGTRGRAVHLDGVPIARIVTGCYDSYATPIVSIDAERARREEQRQRRAEEQARYLSVLDSAAESVRAGLLPDGIEQVQGGQRGGRVLVDGVWLSLPGLLRRAGCAIGDGEIEIDALWRVVGIDPPRSPSANSWPWERSWSAADLAAAVPSNEVRARRVRALSARIRRLPAADLRRAVA